MKQINVLEIKDFKEIAVKVKRAFYLRKTEWWSNPPPFFIYE